MASPPANRTAISGWCSDFQVSAALKLSWSFSNRSSGPLVCCRPELWLRLLHEVEPVRGMGGAGGDFLPSANQLLQRELAHRLQHAEPRLAVSLLTALQEASREERRQGVEDVGDIGCRVAGRGRA